MFFKRKVNQEALKNINELGKWYYYIDFDGIEVRKDLKKNSSDGFKNWDHYLKDCLPDRTGKRILDIGCNAGIYDLEMARSGAREVIGVDIQTAQAEFVKIFFEQKWGSEVKNLRYIERDVGVEGVRDLGHFDFVCLFCVVYHFREKIHFVMDDLSQITETVVFQGNLNRLQSSKYKDRIGTEFSGIAGMKQLLIQHGFSNIDVFDKNNYPKPVVIGRK